MDILINPLIAYLDPGSGALILQMIAATVIMSGIYFRRFLTFPIVLVRRVFKKSATDQTHED